MCSLTMCPNQYNYLGQLHACIVKEKYRMTWTYDAGTLVFLNMLYSNIMKHNHFVYVRGTYLYLN